MPTTSSNSTDAPTDVSQIGKLNDAIEVNVSLFLYRFFHSFGQCSQYYNIKSMFFVVL